MSLIWTVSLALLTSVATILVMIRGDLPFRLPVDVPNERSLHSEPVLRCGGIAVVIAVWLATVPLRLELPWLIASTVALSAVSFIDDLRGLPILSRLIVHFITAGVFAFQLPLPLSGIILATICITASTNFYNFMDGANGLAGGVAAIGFAVMGIAAFIYGDLEVSLIASAVAAASAGFLLFNFGNAKIFLGDTGSIPLGFMAGALGIAGWARGVWPLIFPVLVFAPFILDAMITLAKRIHSRHIVWQSHREHYYQRLIQMGWSHQRVALIYYALTAIGGSLGLFILDKRKSAQLLGCVVFLVIALFLMWKTDKLWAERQ